MSWFFCQIRLCILEITLSACSKLEKKRKKKGLKQIVAVALNYCQVYVGRNGKFEQIGKKLNGYFCSNFQDYLTDGHKTPASDSQNDCELEEAMQSGGTTTLKYHRKVDTGDSKDVVIEVMFSHLSITYIWIALLPLQGGCVF